MDAWRLVAARRYKQQPGDHTCAPGTVHAADCNSHTDSLAAARRPKQRYAGALALAAGLVICGLPWGQISGDPAVINAITGSQEDDTVNRIDGKRRRRAAGQGIDR